MTPGPGQVASSVHSIMVSLLQVKENGLAKDKKYMWVIGCSIQSKEVNYSYLKLCEADIKLKDYPLAIKKYSAL